jgi:methionyl-tRNA synthetase
VDVPHFLSHYDPDPLRNILTCNLIGAVGTRERSALSPGQVLRPPEPLFKKLDESVIEEEYARLEG